MQFSEKNSQKYRMYEKGLAFFHTRIYDRYDLTATHESNIYNNQDRREARIYGFLLWIFAFCYIVWIHISRITRLIFLYKKNHGRRKKTYKN